VRRSELGDVDKPVVDCLARDLEQAGEVIADRASMQNLRARSLWSGLKRMGRRLFMPSS